MSFQWISRLNKIQLTLAIISSVFFAYSTLAQTESRPLGFPDNSRCLKWPGVSLYQDQSSQVKFVDYIPTNINQSKVNSVPIFVTLHGSHGLAEAEMKDWYQYAEKRGFAIISIQWFLGNEYYMPPDMVYKAVVSRIEQLRKMYPALRRNSNMVHGFSRGATYMPAMALYDAKVGNNYFSMFLINAGVWPKNNPPRYMQPLFNSNDRNLYAGKHFCAYYGDRDESANLPKYDGLEMKKVIEQHGGTYDLFLTESLGTHRGLLKNSSLVEQVLNAWLKL